MITLKQCDCFELLNTLTDNSIDLIATDPPYYRVKTDAWDKQWKTKADYLAWLERVIVEYRRVLKPNGSIYLFAGPYLAAEIEVMMGKYFNVLNHIIWAKPSGPANRCSKKIFRHYFPQTERILFAEQQNADSKASTTSEYHARCNELRQTIFEPLRAYFAQEKARCGIRSKQIQNGMFALTGKRYVFDRHACSKTQWELPTREQYEAAQIVFNNYQTENYLQRDYTVLKKEYSHLKRKYEYLRKDYEHLKAQYEHLRRPFFASTDRPFTDFWMYKSVPYYPGKHPCEKPLELMQHIIQTSSHPGSIVLDTFAGSATTAIAADSLGRDFIGCEKGEKEYQQAIHRMK